MKKISRIPRPLARVRCAGGCASAALALALFAGGPPPAEAWGFTGHRLVNRAAIGTLPDALRTLFEANADYLAEHAIDADLQRLGPGDPAHFLDMDAFGAYPFSAIPIDEAEHLVRHGEAAREKGRLPWRIGELYRELAAAFAGRDAAGALARAAELGHFVADAHVPLHAALNYDGQLSGQSGLHGRWESELVERFERQIQEGLSPEPAHNVSDSVALSFRVLRESFQGSLEVLASDRASVGPRDFADTPEDDRYGAAYYTNLYAREGQRVRTRLAQAASTLGSLWLSAWQEAGRPALDAEFRFPYVRRQARAVLVSLDGAGAPLIEDAVARGLMPRLARLRGAGAVARTLPALPCKTAVSHAALYTGAWSDLNGIGGNDLTPPDASILEWGSGFSSTYLTAEPLWVTAARQGLEATVVSATQVFPFEPFLVDKRYDRHYGWRLALFDGYQNFEAGDAVYTAASLSLRPASGWLGALPEHEGEARELAIEVAGATIDGILYDDPADATRGFDTLYLGLDKDPTGGATLKPAAPREPGDTSAFAGLRVPLAGGEAVVHFRLFGLDPRAAELLLYRSAPHVLRSSRPRLEAAALEASGGFLGNGASHSYKEGALGPPLWAGGDGTAERRYLETVSLVVQQFTRLTEFGLERTSWDVLFSYLPYPDEALHLWLGHLDPELPGHQPELASRLRPFLDRVLALCDGFLARVADLAGERTILAVASDHGLRATDRVFRPNVALAAAGLLAVDADGAVDLARTQAFYAPGGFVVTNRDSRPAGVVPRERETALSVAVGAALRGVRDPLGGAPVVRELLEPGREDAAPAFGGATGGQFYLSLAPRYRVASETRGAVVEAAAPSGEHLSNPEAPEMQPTLTLVGPGVAHGVDLGLVNQIDVAPTLCALLGIEPPAHATGRALKRALAKLD